VARAYGKMAACSRKNYIFNWLGLGTAIICWRAAPFWTTAPGPRSIRQFAAKHDKYRFKRRGIVISASLRASSEAVRGMIVQVFCPRPWIFARDGGHKT